MKSVAKKLAKSVLLLVILDWLMLPATLAAGVLLKAVRRMGLARLSQNRKVLMKLGVLPIRRHYYEPLVHPEDLHRPLEAERELPGIDWRLPEQLAMLRELCYAGELQHLTEPSTDRAEFRLSNGSFESGDAEFLYQMIRAKKPRCIIEIGSGYSTLIARRATRRNREEVGSYVCRHLCIEPFEARWLDELDISVMRKRVEEVDLTLFSELEAGDLLFIDSSHIIRPQGDVVTEYLQILPSLRPGVIVHVHDVFSPRDYPREWVLEHARLWNEQYLLEAFLTQNDSWGVVAALNMLRHRHFEELRRACPYLTERSEPGSIYIQRVK